MNNTDSLSAFEPNEVSPHYGILFNIFIRNKSEASFIGASLVPILIGKHFF
jgi:hypothetical protein